MKRACVVWAVLLLACGTHDGSPTNDGYRAPAGNSTTAMGNSRPSVGSSPSVAASPATPTEDPELGELRSYVVPRTELLSDMEMDPFAIRAASQQFLTRLTDADATVFLGLLVQVNDMLTGASDLGSFRPPQAAMDLLSKYADVPYLEGFAQAAPANGTEKSLGRLRSALVQVAFTPTCIARCSVQTLQALMTTIGYDKLLKDGVSSLVGNLPGGALVGSLMRKCVLEGNCTTSVLREAGLKFVAKTAFLTFAPELALVVTLYEFAEVAWAAAKYHEANIRECEAYQLRNMCDGSTPDEELPAEPVFPTPVFPPPEPEPEPAPACCAPGITLDPCLFSAMQMVTCDAPGSLPPADCVVSSSGSDASLCCPIPTAVELDRC